MGSSHLVDLQLVDNILHTPEQVDVILSLTKGLHVDRALLSVKYIALQLSIVSNRHLLIKGVEPEVHLTVRVKVQLRHEPNLTKCSQVKPFREFEKTLGRESST